MFKIKLSILLLISSFIFSCTNNQLNYSNKKYSVAYIGGEFDGLVLKNYLTGSLKNLNIYDPASKYQIQATIVHNSDLFITNTDNTSDREKISTTLYVIVKNNHIGCRIYKDDINVSQFYIYASSDKFLSNKIALEKIKKINTEAAVEQFINKLYVNENKCDSSFWRRIRF